MNSEEVLIDILSAFESYGIKCWADHGTLLGIVRDGKFIDWDRDVDISVISDNYKDVKSIALKMFGDVDGLVLSISCRNIKILGLDRKIDISFYFRKGDHYVKYIGGPSSSFFINRIRAVLFSLSKKFSRLGGLGYGISSFILCVRAYFGDKRCSIVPDFYFSTISRVGFMGRDIPVPDKKTEYLKYRYGDNWNVPIKDWSYLSDDNTLS